MALFPRVLSAILIAIWFLSPVQAAEEDNREGGIIGTGVVGTITHLGSIYVNGLRLVTEDTMPVAGSVPRRMALELLPGHTVAVVGVPQDGVWHARHIRQILPLVGPITAIEDGRLTVLGTVVEIGDLSIAPNIGDWIAVSGLWKGQRVLASRIERLEVSDHQAQLSGTYLSLDETERLMIGTSRVSGIAPAHLRPGALVRVFGQPSPDGIDATRLETDLFDQSVGLIQVQGYYSEPQPGGLYTVLGSGLIAYTDRPEMINDSVSVIRCGQAGLLRGTTSALVEGRAVDQEFSDLNC